MEVALSALAVLLTASDLFQAVRFMKDLLICQHFLLLKGTLALFSFPDLDQVMKPCIEFG
jgi:hypothetical protein